MFEQYRNYDSVQEVLDDLASSDSRTYKEAILENHKNNNELRKVFKMAYDPFIQYGIKQIPDYRSEPGVGAATLTNVLDHLHVLYTRKKTGHDAQNWLARELEGLSQEDAEVLERVIKRDLRCGVSIKTINKIWSGLIPEFPNMLAQPMKDENLKNIRYPAVVQEKLDGQRVNLILKDGVMTVRTRNGKELQELRELFEPEVVEAFGGKSIVLDGELLVLDQNGEELPRKKGNGILNKVQKGTATDDEKSRVVVYLWDIINYQRFMEGYQPNFGYNKRFSILQSTLDGSYKHLKLVESQEVESFYEAKRFFERKLSEGKEGAIIKNIDHDWENGRSKSQVKMKSEKSADLRVVGIEEGKGKFSGMLGNFILESSDGALEVSAGSGLSEKQREDYFTNEMIGKIVAVKYNDVIDKDGEDKKSLFLPIFVEVRDDKDIADSLDELK